MVLDTMTLEELIREIKTDFSEVKGRWKNYVRKFRKTAQKRTMFPWLWEANIKTRRFNEWYISFYAESKKEVGILNPTFTMLFKYKGQLLVGAVTNDVVNSSTVPSFEQYTLSRFLEAKRPETPPFTSIPKRWGRSPRHWKTCSGTRLSAAKCAGAKAAAPSFFRNTPSPAV